MHDPLTRALIQRGARANMRLLDGMIARFDNQQREPQPQPQPKAPPVEKRPHAEMQPQSEAPPVEAPPAGMIQHRGWTITKEPSGWYIRKGARNEDGRRCRYRDHIAPVEFTPEQVCCEYDRLYPEAAKAAAEPEMGAAQQRRMKRDIQRRMQRGF